MISASDGAQKLGEAAGIDRFVPKPFLHPELAEAISALLAPTLGKYFPLGVKIFWPGAGWPTKDGPR